jgi:glycosyltransferase involved in cell wall biosynthesis
LATISGAKGSLVAHLVTCGFADVASAIRNALKNIPKGSPMFLGLFTQLLGPGGIEAAGRQAAAALASIAAEEKTNYFVLSINDNSGVQSIHYGVTEFQFEGFGGHKARCIVKALSLASSSRIGYLGHVGLAPLGPTLRLRGMHGYVVATHGIEVWKRLRPLRLLGLRGAACVTAPSRFTADKVIEENDVPRERVWILPWGLDPEFESRRLTRCSMLTRPAGKIILTVTRLAAAERYKGVDHVIQAMPDLLRLIPDLTYIVVGDGDDRPRLAALATTLGVASRVVFTGRQTDEEVAYYHSAADIYAMPSCGEGFGIVFLEAMACHKPVVAARAAAAPELVKHKETGLLVNYGNVPELTETLVRLLSDTDLSTRLGQAGRESITAHYSFPRFRSQLKDLVEHTTPV